MKTRRPNAGRRTPSTQPPIPKTQHLTPDTVALALIGLIFFIAALGGGTIYDSYTLSPNLGAVDMRPGLFDLMAVPLITLVAAAALAVAFRSGGRIPNRNMPGFAFGLFLLWGALSLLHTRSLSAGVTVFAFFAVAFALGVTVARVARTRQAILVLLLALVGAATLVAGIGINEYLMSWRTGNSLWRVFATFVNPDFLAGYLILVIPISVALFFASENSSLTLLSGLALLLQALCLLLTQSRLGLLALLVAMIVFAALVWRSRVLTGSAKRRALVLVALAIVALLVGARPILKRLRESGGESYSARFRLLTWRGVQRMAAANPLLGTGLGSFETAYPHYAVAGFTRHAHNGVLQLAGETGYPGPLFLLAGLAGTLATGAAALLRTTDDGQAGRKGEGEKGRRGELTVNGRSPDDPTPNTQHPTPSCRLLLAGLLAGIVSGVIHNLFDSDIYVPASAMTLGAVCGMTIALAGTLTRDEETKAATERDHRPILRILALATAVLLAGYGVMAMGGRLRAYDAAGAENIAAAEEGYRAALSFDPWNPEYHLSLAALNVATNRPDEAIREYEAAIKAAPIGKAYYQYGRFLARIGRPAEAVKMFERAREVEPLNLRNLLALGEAYKAVGRPADAESVYREMIRLYRSPFGAIRPTPELVDWEFGIAYLGLAESAIQRNDQQAAESDLRDGAGILGEFWRQRNLQIAAILIRPDVRALTADRYDWALTQWAETLRKLGRAQEAAEIDRRLAEYRAERQKGAE